MIFFGFVFIFQSVAVVLAICYILGLKSLICVLFAAFWSRKSLICVLFAAFWSLNLSDLRAICCVFELIFFISHAICSISELKSQIWAAKIVNLHDNCNILVFTHFPMVFNDVWIVFTVFLVVFNDLSVAPKFFKVFSRALEGLGFQLKV